MKAFIVEEKSKPKFVTEMPSTITVNTKVVDNSTNIFVYDSPRAINEGDSKKVKIEVSGLDPAY